MLQRYERHRHDAETALRQAIQELARTGQVSDATLRAVSVPGQPLPRAALDALVTLQQDPTRFDSLVQKLTTGLAITRLTWECHDVHDQLAASTEANQELTDEQRRLLEKRLEGLQRDLNQVIAKKEVLERHLQPALDALLTEYTAVQDSATRAGLRAPGAGHTRDALSHPIARGLRPLGAHDGLSRLESPGSRLSVYGPRYPGPRAPVLAAARPSDARARVDTGAALAGPGGRAGLSQGRRLPRHVPPPVHSLLARSRPLWPLRGPHHDACTGGVVCGHPGPGRRDSDGGRYRTGPRHAAHPDLACAWLSSPPPGHHGNTPRLGTDDQYAVPPPVCQSHARCSGCSASA